MAFDPLFRVRPFRRRSVSGQPAGIDAPEPTAPQNDFVFCPSAGERWTFDGEQIAVNGVSAERIIHECANDGGLLADMISALTAYRNVVWERTGSGAGEFQTALDALLHRALTRVGHLFHGLASGVHFEFVNGQLWINNVDVQALMELYRRQPTALARAYLMTFVHKLGLILSRPNDNPAIDGIWEKAHQILGSLFHLLATTPAHDLHLLGAARRPGDGHSAP